MEETEEERTERYKGACANVLVHAMESTALPRSQSFEPLCTHSHGPFFLTVAIANGVMGEIRTLLKPLKDKEEWEAEVGFYQGKEWRPGDLWAVTREPSESLVFEVETDPGWAPLEGTYAEIQNRLLLFTGLDEDDKDELFSLLALRASLQWGSQKHLTKRHLIRQGGATSPSVVDAESRLKAFDSLRRALSHLE
jgi:hypothetical protein